MSARADPADWQRTGRTRDGATYRVRPIRAEDAQRERDFISGLSEEARYNRLMYALREPSREFIEHLVQVDYHGDMAFVAVVGHGESERIIGVARYAADPSGTDCEFAVTVADEWQCRGIGTTLMKVLFEYARAQGFCRVYGTILATNDRMLKLAGWLGLQTRPVPGCATLVEAWRDLTAA